MSDKDEDVSAVAGQKAVQMVTIAAVAAEAMAQIAAMRAREHAQQNEREAQTLRAQRAARYAEDRLRWETVLDPEKRAKANLHDVGFAWGTAQGWKGDPLADRVTDLSEDLMRDIRPDVMEKYDELRRQGVDAVPAMRTVAPLFDQERVFTGEAPPHRDPLVAAEPVATDGRTPADIASELAPVAPADYTDSERQALAAVVGGASVAEGSTSLGSSRSLS